jgi:hypothetical protein
MRSQRNAIEKRERRIDEGLKETFPASDTPTFVGKGAPNLLRASPRTALHVPDLEPVRNG